MDCVNRRVWPEALKREIVGASFEPGASASVVARRYDVNSNQLFMWRLLYRDGLLAPTAESGPSLLPVTITDEQAEEKTSAPQEIGRLEIELPSEGQPGEQATMFFRDPAGNALEFKAFADLSQLFATAVGQAPLAPPS
jgi:transposase-like protein